MITEDYVSYEVSKLLKEKGFDYQGFDYIDFEGEVIKQDRPTLQMAMKWLREVHSLCIGIYYLWPCGYEIEICKIGKDTPISEFEAIREHAYDTYEEAVESAIKYCLENLI